jgi:type III secretion protein D
VNQSWEVADVIATTIESALRVPGLHAAYLGGGRFAVSGTVPDPAQVLGAAPQLRKDLGANVRAIEFELSRIRTTAAFSAAVSADALHYSERPDGAKVFAEKKI